MVVDSEEEVVVVEEEIEAALGVGEEVQVLQEGEDLVEAVTVVASEEAVAVVIVAAVDSVVAVEVDLVVEVAGMPVKVRDDSVLAAVEEELGVEVEDEVVEDLVG